MNITPYMRALAVACMSCTLGACVIAEPDEADIEEAAGMSVQEEDVASAAATIAQSGDDEADAVGCGGNSKNWCIVKCSKTGSHLHVVGTRNQLGGICAAPGETFCHSHMLGYRTSACWGYANNN